MARYSIDGQILTDMADAIRTSKGEVPTLRSTTITNDVSINYLNFVEGTTYKVVVTPTTVAGTADGYFALRPSGGGEIIPITESFTYTANEPVEFVFTSPYEGEALFRNYPSDDFFTAIKAGTLTIIEVYSYTPGEMVAEIQDVMSNSCPPAVEDSLIMHTTTQYTNSRVEKIGPYAFASGELVNASFPNVTKIDTSAFQYCYDLKSINIPLVADLGGSAFNYCQALESIELPALAKASSSSRMFGNCTKLTKVDLGPVDKIAANAFNGSKVLATLILRGETMTALAATSAFTSTPMASGTGYIYVPAALVDSYKAATNWSTYAAQFRAIEDYPDICG